MESIIKKEAEIEEKIREKKEAFIEAKDKIIHETTDKLKVKLNDIKSKTSSASGSQSNSSEEMPNKQQR